MWFFKGKSLSNIPNQNAGATQKKAKLPRFSLVKKRKQEVGVTRTQQTVISTTVSHTTTIGRRRSFVRIFCVMQTAAYGQTRPEDNTW